MPLAGAAPIGSGSCISSVTSSGSVSTSLSNGYCYIGFAATGTNTWTVPAGVSSIDFIVVAGGGAGGSGAWGGGGGAGGVVIYETYAVTSGASLDLNVGTGGTPGTAILDPALNRSGSGTDSWIGSSSGVVARGGGAGASYAYNSADIYTVGANGGSGGGGTEHVNTNNVGGSSTQTLPPGAKQKFGTGGGSGSQSGNQSGGGGGGALTSGSATTVGTGATIAGAGGSGTNAVATYLNAFATPYGVSSYIAGGGAGGSQSATQALGGAGGGGKGGYTGARVGTDGVASTGSGGGGASYASATYQGGAGGSGLIIIRYTADTLAPSFSGSTTFLVPENTNSSTNIGTVRVSESATISLSSGADSSTVTLIYGDSATAYLRFISSPNFEAPTDSGPNNTYDFTVRATDAAGNFSTQVMAISVTNLNEAPVITNSASAPTVSIPQDENVSAVADFDATDVDAGSTLTFSISGTDAGDFTIDSTTGVLTFAANPDFEAPADSDLNNIYLVTVTILDGALADTQALTITIRNVNESGSVIAPSINGLVYKGISTTITVSTNVAGKVRFMFSGKKITNCLSRSTSGTYPTFTATCSWKPPIRGDQLLTAVLVPTDNTFSTSTSVATKVFVLTRATKR
jgi:hypothetical protein